MDALKRVVLAVGVMLMASVSAWAGLEIDETNFPDSVFREYLSSNFDTDSDDMLNEEEITAVTSISVSGQGISSLQGVEYFTALTMLDCLNNQLTELDVSKNTALTWLDCGDNQLTALDVSKNIALTSLYCWSNQLTALDVSNNTALTTLSCGDNQLTALYVSQNPALTYLYCGSNQLTALDVSHNTALKNLLCNYSHLTALDVSHNTALEFLDFGSNDVTALDVSNNKELRTLVFGENKLTNIDVSNNTKLTRLDCSDNNLTALDVSHNQDLAIMYCGNTNIAELDLTNNTALVLLSCGHNQLRTLDVGNNTKLVSLRCQSNQLTALDLSNNVSLNNSGTEINYEISDDDSYYFTASVNLSSQTLPLSAASLVSGGTSSYVLNASALDPTLDISRISSIDVEDSSGSAITCTTDASAREFRFSAKPKTLTYRYNTGWQDTYMKVTATFSGDVEPVLVSGDIAIDEANFPDSVFREYVKGFDTDNDDVLSASEIAAVKYIDADNMGISSLYGVEYFTSLTSLSCVYNKLTELDVSSNIALTYLDCGNNQLTTLNISKNTDLNILYCEENRLMELDVSNNTTLTTLSCGYNKLTELDVSNNTALTNLYCDENQLTAIDVSQNSALTSLYCYLQYLDVASPDTTSRADYPYSFNLRALNTSLEIGNVSSIDATDFNDSSITVSPDVSTGVIYFSAKPKNLTYNYYTGYSDKYMDVTLTLAGDADNTDAPQITTASLPQGHTGTPYSVNLSTSGTPPITFTTDGLPSWLTLSAAGELSGTPSSQDTYSFTITAANSAGSDTKIYSLEILPAGSSSIELSEANFPDANLRNYLSGSSFDLDGDGYLTDDELQSVYTIELSGLGISSLTGIEHFTNLNYLDCSSNDLTELDISSLTNLEWLRCQNNRLTALDVSHNTKLVALIFDNNYISAIDVSNNPLLEQLFCENTRITALDVSHNPELRMLGCGENLVADPYAAYNIAALDLSNNSKLEFLYCYGNQLGNLDVSNNPSLTFLDCGSNDLTFLDVSNNPSLQILYCTDNMLAALDLSTNTALVSLDNRTQALSLSGEASGNADYPYMLDLNAAKSALGINIDTADFIANVSLRGILDSEGMTVNHSTDVDSGIVYFAGKPEIITYDYATDSSLSASDMPVIVYVDTPDIPQPGSEDIPSGDRVIDYQFTIPEGVSAKLASLFGGNIYQFTDDEIISDTWELDNNDLQAITSLNESVILHLPHVMPKNSGRYLLKLTIPGANAGKLLNLHGITTAEGGNVVSYADLENTDYVLLDEEGNEIDRVPESGVVYTALNLTAGRAHRGVITSVNELERGTILPVEPDESLLEKIAETTNHSVDVIRFITDDNISEPEEPTQAMIEEMQTQKSDIIGKLNTLTVSEDGYYVVKVVLSDDLYAQIDGVSINDLKVYALYDDGKTDQVNTSFITGLLNTWELLTLSGEKLEFGAREFLMVGFLNAGTPFSVYLTKILLMLLAGGCDVGFGLAGLGLAVAILFFRRR